MKGSQRERSSRERRSLGGTERWPSETSTVPLASCAPRQGVAVALPAHQAGNILPSCSQTLTNPPPPALLPPPGHNTHLAVGAVQGFRCMAGAQGRRALTQRCCCGRFPTNTQPAATGLPGSAVVSQAAGGSSAGSLPAPALAIAQPGRP